MPGWWCKSLRRWKKDHRANTLLTTDSQEGTTRRLLTLKPPTAIVHIFWKDYYSENTQKTATNIEVEILIRSGYSLSS